MSEELKRRYYKNQYLRIDGSNEEIVEKLLNVKYTSSPRKDYYISISDLDFSGIREPNVLLCQGVDDYDNIYGTVNIIITDAGTLIRKWREIPETVEYVIVTSSNNNLMYRNNRNKFDYLEILNYYESEEETVKKIINELIEDGIRDEVNIVGRTILYYMFRNRMFERMIEMIERDKFRGETYDIISKIERDKIGILGEVIKNVCYDGDEEMRKMAIMIIDRMSDRMLNENSKVINSIIKTEDIEIIMCGLRKIRNYEVLESSSYENLLKKEYLFGDEDTETIEFMTRKNEKRIVIHKAISERIEELKR